MLGIWDYTVVLTYCSLLSAVTGILVSLDGHGHPYIGVMFLLLCGLCDTFDGRVARSKKNRTKKEKDFGVQIDSLSDLVAFGVLPVCVGMAMYKRTMFDETMSVTPNTVLFSIPVAVLILISAVFVLAALVRLAYFNITVEETQGEGLGDKKHYFGLPVTTTALIFPTFMLLRYTLLLCNFDIGFLYYIILIIVAILFVMKFKLKKPGTLMIYFMVFIGAIEFFAVVLLKIFVR
ncbi:MAG: phosphatidylserine synthase [Eubacterium sp.]|jgi:CDP-diacylglycerol--serine O-phosphatidyltransferase|nr:phosphatidylserine synthase [Eubacterium sp.]